MRRFVLLAVILAASPAAADPALALGLDYTVARGGAFEAWDLGTRLEAGLFFRIKNWQATGSISAAWVDSSRPVRDGDELTLIGAGGRLAYHHRISRHGVLLFAAGFERIWVNGATPVRRGCRQTGACFAGFYTETPDYDAWTPQLRVGIGPDLNHPGVVVGGTFEIIVEPMTFRDVPSDGITAVALYGAFTFTFGGGPTRL